MHRSPELLDRLAAIEERTGKKLLAEALRTEALAVLEASVARGEVGQLRALTTALLARGRAPERALELARRDVTLRQDVDGLRVLSWACRRNGRQEEPKSRSRTNT